MPLQMFIFMLKTKYGSVWRPLIESVDDWPLALCDGSTVDDRDLVETDHVRRHYTGSTMYLMHNPGQRFYYLSNQGRNDVLLFKNFDSERGVKARCVFLGLWVDKLPLTVGRCTSCILPSSIRDSEHYATSKY